MAEISKTTDQALAALLELSEAGPMTAAEVSRSLGLNRTVVHRLLTTLHRRGFVIRQNGGYAPGALLVRMAAGVQPELRAAAASVMSRLAAETGETVVLHIADGDESIVLEEVVGSRHVVRVHHPIGTRHPLSKGASGRALLAHMDERAINRITSKTDNPEGLRHQLESVRQLGYSISHDELQDDVYGLAVPVRGEPAPVASLAILLPTPRATGILEYLPQLTSAAERVADSLLGQAASR